MDKKYNASSIEVLTGLDPVRKRPGMYTNTYNPNHLAQEVIDNSVDEAMEGHASVISVKIWANNAMTVEDNGRGMPVDEHPGMKKSGVEVILTTLHAGGKFSDSNYQYSGGLHGVGVSVVNALSEQLKVEIKRQGKQYAMNFHNGVAQNELTIIGEVGQKNTGTSVYFHPNAKFFESATFDLKQLKIFLRAKAVLCPGLMVKYENEHSEEKIEWLYQNGVLEYLQNQLKEELIIPKECFYFNHVEEQGEVVLALSWMLENGESITESYVNTIPTIQGGTHNNGLRSGLTDSIKEFLEIHNLLPRGIRIVAEDICKQLAFVLAIKIKDPQFLGQTKERLSSREAANLVNQVVKDNFSLWLNEHMNDARKITEIIINNARNRQKSSQTVVRKKIVSGPALPGKLTDCVSQDISQTELFLVEGDSAGGSARQARDKSFQAIMPLRGKILNTWEVSHQQVLSSEEIHDISVAIGIEPNSYSLENLRYGKICILADADSDGLHIATLLCALFLKHFRVLIEQGHIYIAMPPLYRVDIGKQTWYAVDDEERDHILSTHGKANAKSQITRFKGLGEMNPIQLRESTLHPDTRRLIQLSINEEDDSIEMMDRLLGKKRISDRKIWLEEKGNLVQI